MNKKKLTPSQAIVIFGVFVIIFGVVLGIVDYLEELTINLVIADILTIALGILMIYLGKRTDF